MIIEATRKPVVTIERDGSRVIDYGGRIRIPRGITRDYTAGTTTEYITEEQAKYVLSVGEGSNVRYLYVPTLIAALYHANNTANLLLEGSRATGKSWLARHDFHLRALRTPGFSYVIVRRTYKELQKTHIRYIEAEMKSLGGVYNRSDKICRYHNESIGFFSQVETEQDVLNLLGGDFHAILFDEGTTIDFEWQQKLASSVRQGAALVRVTTNPLGHSTDDIWKYYVEKEVPAEEDDEYDPNDYFHLHTSMSDNPFIDVNRYKKRFAGLPEHVKRAWLHGERLVEDALFDFRRTKNGKQYHEINELPTFNGQSIFSQPWVRFYRAYDAGYYPDPAYCLWIAVVGRQVIPFKEKVWIRKTGEEIATDIVEETKKLGIKIAETFCDPSISRHDTADVYTVMDKMERCGVPMTPAVNDRELFASAVHSALQMEIEPDVPRVQILRPGSGADLGCPYLLKSIPSQRFDPKKPMAMAPHRHDHPAVTLAYFLMSWSSEASSAPGMKHRLMPWMKKVAKAGKALGSGQVRRAH